jgi:hypothetical protein
MRRVVCGLFFAFSTLVIPSYSYADTLYGITFSNSQLIRIDSNTAVSTLVGTVNETFGSELAAFGGALYSFDQSGNGTFRQIDPSNASTITSTVAGTFIPGEGGMSFRSDGKAFLSGSEGSSGHLWECDVTVSNGCTNVAALQISMDGLAFSSTNVLYGLSQSPVGTAQPSLFTINTGTGAETLIGATGVNGVNLAGLTFDSSGRLLAAIDSSLYSINLGTGAATLIGDTGFSGIAGLTELQGTTAVPEPGTVTLLLSSLAAVTAFRRKFVKH